MPILVEMPIPEREKRYGHYKAVVLSMIADKAAFVCTDPTLLAQTTDRLAKAIIDLGMRNDWMVRGSKVEGRIWLEMRGAPA